MPMPGEPVLAIQVTASVIGPDDILKVIDQGDDTIERRQYPVLRAYDRSRDNRTD